MANTVYSNKVIISIHALRGEGDGGICKSLPALIISIHALRGEGDLLSSSYSNKYSFHFNPRPPWGGRQ